MRLFKALKYIGTSAVQFAKQHPHQMVGWASLVCASLVGAAAPDAVSGEAAIDRLKCMSFLLTRMYCEAFGMSDQCALFYSMSRQMTPEQIQTCNEYAATVPFTM